MLKCVFVLLHGNASVESGFSVNGEMLVGNLHAESLVAQHELYDGVLAAGGVTTVEVDKSMLQHVRGAHSRYQESLRTDDEVRRASDMKRAADQIKLLKTKKAKIAETIALESQNIDRDIVDLEKILKK